jgi:hypothetical protein
MIAQELNLKFVPTNYLFWWLGREPSQREFKIITTFLKQIRIIFNINAANKRGH